MNRGTEIHRVHRRWVAALAAVAALSTVGVAAGAGSALADVPTTGHYCAIRDKAAIRPEPADVPARDNLLLGQGFQVTDRAGEHYVHGYKVVNNVHGYVLNDSLGAC